MSCLQPIELVQGFVSLDNEDDGNCMRLLPGMHRHVPEWLASMEDKRATTNQSFPSVTPETFTKQDKRAFGIDWEFVIHSRGGVTLTKPFVPVYRTKHGRYSYTPRAAPRLHRDSR